MSDLPALKSPAMPALPEIFSKLQPVELPELTFDKGFISGWIHERKTARIARVSEHEALIEENRYKATHFKTEALVEALTFGAKYQAVLSDYNHRIKMNELEQIHKQEIIREQVYKNQILEMDLEDARLNHRLKLKEYNSVLEDEDR